MRGSLRQQSKGSWTIILEAPRDAVTGRRRQRAITIRGTKRDAERRVAELLSQMNKGVPLDTNRQPLREYLEMWLRDVVAVRNRPRTTEAYATIVHRHIVPVLGGITLPRLQASDVERMEAALLSSGLTANTVRHVHVVLAKALKDAMHKGMIHRNACQLVPPPKVGKYEVNVPDMAGIARILKQADNTPYGPALRFMASTGIRRGEAIALRWERVDLERGVASIVETAQRVKGKGIIVQRPKSAAGKRGIALDKDTVAMLRQHRGQQMLRQVELEGVYADNGLVFPGLLGEFLDPSLLTKSFKKLACQAGYPSLRLHDLRHGHAAGLIRAGVHPRVVQERLGHASAAFTMQVYGHVAAGLQAQAAAAFAELLSEAERG